MTSQPNTKDSMKSTWNRGDRKDWNRHQWAIHYLGTYPIDWSKPVPIHAKTDKVPHLPQWTQHRWVLAYAAIPLLVHQALLLLPGPKQLSSGAVFGLYFMSFNFIIVREVRVLKMLGHVYGFLDGDVHERDGVPDIGTGEVARSLWRLTGSRVGMSIWLCYDPSISPLDAMSSLRWWAWLVLEIGLYSIVLDFWYYWLHRGSHDVSYLWKFHRKHHLTKHPNSLLSGYADHEQKFFDSVGVPLITYFSFWAVGLPLGFYDWWICHQYVSFTEIIGHSGLRVFHTAPTTLSWLLQTFRSEIVVEDHDLHHRKGWRKSYNYGKQTRLWDRIFGTCYDRIELVPENIDYVNEAYIPLLEHYKQPPSG